MRTQEKLIYTNERGESIEFSPASSYHVNFKDVTGLSDVRNAIYSTNSMGRTATHTWAIGSKAAILTSWDTSRSGTSKRRRTYAGS